MWRCQAHAFRGFAPAAGEALNTQRSEMLGSLLASQCFLPSLLSPALMSCIYAANQTLAASLHEMLALSTLPHARLPDRVLHDKTVYKIKRFPAVHAWENSALGKWASPYRITILFFSQIQLDIAWTINAFYMIYCILYHSSPLILAGKRFLFWTIVYFLMNI